eukprot:550978-Pyramimonas_sp.AAC.1
MTCRAGGLRKPPRKVAMACRVKTRFLSSLRRRRRETETPEAWARPSSPRRPSSAPRFLRGE